jgi:hypothetical protein
MANIVVPTKTQCHSGGDICCTYIVMCVLVGDTKVKVKVTLEQTTKAHGGEKRNCFTLSLTSALDEVGG